MGTETKDEMSSPDENKSDIKNLANDLKIDKRCRICAENLIAIDSKIAHVFSEEPSSRDLFQNIRKYLHITVSMKDKLPKMVCGYCVKKLNEIHEFATMATRSQEKLRLELFKSFSDNPIVNENINISDNAAIKSKDHGLLHNILTKSSNDMPNNEDSVQVRERTPSTEEMEVKVDPMIFLQCELDQPSSNEYSNCSDDYYQEINSFKTSLSVNKRNENTMNIENNTSCKNENNLENDSEDNDIDMEDYEDNCDEEELDEADDLSIKNNTKSHVCKICSRTYASQILLQNHLWSHLPTSVKDFHNFVDKTSISHSQRNCENSANGICNNTFNNYYICPICGKKISTKGNLKVHLETHRPKGKYGCDICGRIFKTHSNLFRHKEYHSGIQFPCNVCGRVYPTNSTLRAHSITHSDLRPHACPLCDKTFKRNQDLKFHINQHTGARPYQCPYCPKAFASSGNCFSHRKRMHPKEVHRDRQRAADLMR